jgi:hypothetical protein
MGMIDTQSVETARLPNKGSTRQGPVQGVNVRLIALAGFFLLTPVSRLCPAYGSPC